MAVDSDFIDSNSGMGIELDEGVIGTTQLDYNQTNPFYDSVPQNLINSRYEATRPYTDTPWYFLKGTFIPHPKSILEYSDIAYTIINENEKQGIYSDYQYKRKFIIKSKNDEYKDIAVEVSVLSEQQHISGGVINVITESKLIVSVWLNADDYYSKDPDFSYGKDGAGSPLFNESAIAHIRIWFYQYNKTEDFINREISSLNPLNLGFVAQLTYVYNDDPYNPTSSDVNVTISYMIALENERTINMLVDNNTDMTDDSTDTEDFGGYGDNHSDPMDFPSLAHDRP